MRVPQVNEFDERARDVSVGVGAVVGPPGGVIGCIWPAVIVVVPIVSEPGPEPTETTAVSIMPAATAMIMERKPTPHMSARRSPPALARSVAAGNQRIHFFHVTVFTQPRPSRTFSDVQVSRAPYSVQLVATVPLRRRGRCPHQRRRAVDTDLGDKTLDHRRWEKTRGVITPREPTTHFHRY
jgi:hypothetical protein